MNILRNLEWTANQHLGTTTYTYDGDGGRVKKMVSIPNDGTYTTTYIGSLFERQETPSGTKTFNHIYLGANKIASIENRAASSDVLYFHPDHLGSTSVVTDQTGTVVQHIEYDPFGKVILDEKVDKDKGTSYKFTGKELDSNELYYYGARYYDPELCRFITADPTIQRPGDAQDLNRYAYCRNNPVKYTDPSGYGWKKFWKQYGDWISPLTRAIVTKDWAHFGLQVLDVCGVVGGVLAGAPLIAVASALSYSSSATECMPGRASHNISRGLDYASLAISAVSLGLDLSTSVKNYSDVSKVNNEITKQIKEVSMLEQTTENVEKLNQLNQVQGVIRPLTMAYSVKPFAMISGFFAGAVIQGIRSDWNLESMIRGGIAGGRLGNKSSGTRVGFTDNAFCGQFEPYLQGVSNFHASVSIETKIFGLNCYAKTHEWNWRKGTEISYSTRDIDPKEQIKWTGFLF